MQCNEVDVFCLIICFEIGVEYCAARFVADQIYMRASFAKEIPFLQNTVCIFITLGSLFESVQ